MHRVLLFAALAGSTLAGTPAIAAAQEDPAIALRLNKRDPLQRGERVKVFVETANDGYVMVLHAEPSGRVRVLFPLDPFYDDYVRGHDRIEIRGRGNREAFRVLENDGVGTLFAVYSRDPFQYGAFVRADHWDYRALDEWRLTADRDPEAELVALAQELTGQTFFEYDIVQYGVGTSYTALNTSFQFSAGVGWGWSPYYWGRPGFVFSVGTGPFYLSYYSRPYRRWASLHFCDPFVYDPWACDLAYWGDPYWYAGSYWGHHHYRDRYYWPYYTQYIYRPVRRVRYVEVPFYRRPTGLRKYAVRPESRSGLSRGVGVRVRSPAQYRTADARRRTTASPTVRAVQGRRTVSPTVRTVQGRRATSPTATPAVQGRRTTAGRATSRTDAPRVRQPRGWGMTNGRRTVESRSSDDDARRGVIDAARPTRRVAPDPRQRTGSAAHQAKPNEGPRRVTVPGRVTRSPVTPTRSATPRRQPTSSTANREPTRSNVQRQPARPTTTRQPTRATVRRQPSRPTVSRQPARPTARRPSARPTVSRPRPSVSRRPARPTVRRTPSTPSRSRPRPTGKRRKN